MKLSNVFENISEDQLIDFEKDVGKSLPDDYRLFLLKNNGGRPEPNIFQTLDGKYESDIQFFYGLVDDDLYGLRDNLIHLRDRLSDREIAIATDSGGNYITINIDSDEVCFFDHEIEEYSLIAKSFSDFIDGMFSIDKEVSALDEAIDGQDVEYFESILESGTRVADIVDEFDQSAFIIACSYGKLKVVKFFVENGANVEGGVYAASSHGYADVVRYLLEHCGDPNERNIDQNNDTALMQASMSGFLDVVKLLVSKGSLFDAKDQYGHTALDKSRWSDNEELVRYLENLTS